MNIKNIIAAAAVTTVGIAAFAGNPAQATTAPTCDAHSATSITATNTDVLLVAPIDADWTGVTQIGPIDITVPADSYTIGYTSYDDHSAGNSDADGNNIEGQTQEQWFFQGLYQGEVVYTSTGTADLPENVDTISGVFGEDVALPAIDSIVMIHVLDVDEDGRFPQSVVPSCVSFTPTVVEEVAVEAPVVEEEPQVLAAVVEAPVVEEAPQLADTGVSAVAAIGTGFSVLAATAASSRTRSTKE